MDNKKKIRSRRSRIGRTRLFKILVADDERGGILSLRWLVGDISDADVLGVPPIVNSRLG